MLYAVPSYGTGERWGIMWGYLHNFLAWQKHQACGVRRNTGLDEHASALLLLRRLHTCNGLITSHILANLPSQHKLWYFNGR